MNATQYHVYGLTLSSDISLPQLMPLVSGEDDAVFDLRVRLSGHLEGFHSQSHWFIFRTLPTGEPWVFRAKDKGRYLLRFPDFADFALDANGKDIVCVRRPKTPLDTLRHLLLDQVLPLVLNIKGQKALHAAAVLTPSGVCAFTGPTGVGKSTLAASFLQAGYRVLSDDCLVLKQNAGQILAFPAYPGLRLWEDTLEAIGEDHNHGVPVPVAHYTSKKRLAFVEPQRSFSLGPHPLARIYSLAETSDSDRENGLAAPVMERLSCRDGFMELIPSSFLLDITDRAMLAGQFHFLEDVAHHVPVRRLHVPESFSSLPATRDLILADLENG